MKTTPKAPFTSCFSPGFKPSVVHLLLTGGLLAGASAETKTWALPGVGTWSTPENWTPAGVPLATDDVVVGITTAGIVSLGANQVGSSLVFSNTAALTLNAGGTNRTLVIGGPTTMNGAAGVIIGTTATGQNVNLTTTTFTKNGTGSLEIANANTIGNVALNQGDTIIRNAASLGTSGTITLGASSGTNNATLRIAAITLVKPIVLGGSTGTLILNNLGTSTGTFTGGFTGTGNLRIESILSSASGGINVNTTPIAHTGSLTLTNNGTATANNVTGTVTLNAAISSSVTSVTVNNPSLANAGITKGVQKAVLASTANAYTGDTTISSGARLELGAAEVIPHGSAAGNLIVDGTLILRTATGDSTETVNGLSGAGSITRTGTTGTSTLVVGAKDAGGNFTGPITNGSGVVAFTKTGTGTLVMSGQNTYTGLTTVSGGTLTLEFPDMIADNANIEVSTGATLNLTHGETEVVNSLRFDGSPQTTGKWGAPGNTLADFTSPRITGTGLLEVTNLTADYYWDGTGNSWASVSAWSLNNINAAINPTDIPGIDSATRFGLEGLSTDQTINLNGDQATPSMSFTSPVIFNFLGGNADHVLALSTGGITLSATGGGASFGSATTGQKVDVLLSGNQTWTNLAAGTSLITTKNIVDLGSATLTVTGTGGTSLEGSVTGTGKLVKSGTGTLTLKGASSYTGGTTLNTNGGTLAITNGSALGTGTVGIPKVGANSGTLDLSNDITVPNNFTFASATGFATAGVSAHIRNVSGNNTLTGTLTLNATGGNGINIQSDAGLLTITNSITSTIADATRQLGITGAGNGLISGNIFNTGTANLFTVIKSGTGTWTLSGANTYTGSTIVNAGKLAITQNGSIADTAAVNVAAGATLQLDFTGSDTIGALTLGGVVQGPGTYSAANTGGLITGTGSLVIIDPDPFTPWINSFTFQAGADKSKTGDPDGDGLSNLVEFGLDGDPSSAVPTGKVVGKIDGGHLTLTLPVRSGATFTGTGPLTSAAVNDLIYRIDGSSDLSGFVTAAEETTALSTGLPALSTGWTYRTFRLTATTAAAAKGFLRANVSDAP